MDLVLVRSYLDHLLITRLPFMFCKRPLSLILNAMLFLLVLIRWLSHGTNMPFNHSGIGNGPSFPTYLPAHGGGERGSRSFSQRVVIAFNLICADFKNILTIRGNALSHGTSDTFLALSSSLVELSDLRCQSSLMPKPQMRSSEHISLLELIYLEYTRK